MDNFETDMKKEVPAVRIKRYWDTHPFFAFFIVFVIFFLLFSSVYLFTPGISSRDDHFFHIKFAYLLRTQGWDAVNNFHWIYLSNTSAQNTPYQLSLFQIALIPFTFIKDLVLALKISDIFWASLCLALIYSIFRKTQIKFPLFFAALLLLSSFFVGKILIGRALVLVTAIIFCEIYLAINKKYFWFFLLSIFHILWHQASFLWPLIIAAIVEMARYLDDRTYYKNNFLSAFLAFFVSFAFFPNFPGNIVSYFKNFSSVIFHGSQGTLLGEGAELYPVAPLDGLLNSSGFFLLFSLMGIAVAIYYYIRLRDRDDDQEEIVDRENNILMYSVFIFLSVSLLASFTVSGRFYDFYFPASVYLFAIIVTKIADEQKARIDKSLFTPILVAIIIFSVVSISNVLIEEKKQIFGNDYVHYGQAARWIDEKSDAGEAVFLHNWSWFTMMFFFNNNNYYSMGIEPVALKEYDSSLYWKWSNIFQYNIYCDKEKYCAEEGADMAKKLETSDEEEKNRLLKDEGRKMIESIKNDFGSKFIVSDSPRFNNAVSLNDDMIEDSYEAKSEINGSTVNVYKLR